MYLIKNAYVYDPEPVGVCDVFVGGGRILKVGKRLPVPAEYEIQVIDGTGKILFPGLVDVSVPVLGAGTEEEPEVEASDLLQNGITTVVGEIGTRNPLYSMKNLLAHTRSLCMNGVSAYCLTGSYRDHLRTLEESVLDDLLLLDSVLGTGVIPIEGSGEASMNQEEFEKILQETKIGGKLSGKKGVIVLEVGESEGSLSLLRALPKKRISMEQVIVLPVNRSLELLKEAADPAREEKAYLGISTALPNPLRASQVLRRILDEGEDPDRIVLTTGGTDSQDSMSQKGTESQSVILQEEPDVPDDRLSGVNENLILSPLTGVHQLSSLYVEVKAAVKEQGIPLEKVLPTVTSNPAQFLGLVEKGKIRPKGDADLILADAETMEMKWVMAQGKIMANMP